MEYEVADGREPMRSRARWAGSPATTRGHAAATPDRVHDAGRAVPGEHFFRFAFRRRAAPSAAELYAEARAFLSPPRVWAGWPRWRSATATPSRADERSADAVVLSAEAR
jgi:hypothetical protein